MERLPVALCSTRAAAKAISNRLRQAGFDAQLSERSWLQKLWFVRKGEAGISVDVPGDQFEWVKEFLLKWDASEGLPRDVIRCPECKSLRVQYPQFARHSLLTNFFLGLAAALGLVQKEYYCENCHFTWPKEGTRARRDQPDAPPYSFVKGFGADDAAAPATARAKADRG